MTKIKNEPIFRLIKSLTKAEKRNFKLYAHRTSIQKTFKFIQLFDIIAKMKRYDEKTVLQKVDIISSTQLPNLKAHLYKQILASLRLIHTKHDASLHISEQIDYAKILYQKGLHMQSLKLLLKTKSLAKKHNQHLLIQQILEFEKRINTQHITHSIEGIVEEITSSTIEAANTIKNTILFSNLSLRLFGLYLKMGYVRNEKDKSFITDFFRKHMINYDINELGFFEKLYLYQSHIWYYLILQDFLNCYRYGQRLVNLFHTQPYMIAIEPELYIRTLNSVLSSLFFTRHYTRFLQTLDILNTLKKSNRFKNNFNIFILIEVFYHTHIFNKHFMDGLFQKGICHISEVKTFLENNAFHLDNHRILIFYYKIACMYFGNDDYKNAIIYLNKVINLKDTSLRSDLHCFARILNLISHYELGNHELLEYQIRSTYRFLLKMEDLQEVQKYVLKFLRRTSHIDTKELSKVFIQCRNDLKQWINDPYEKRAFLYLDFISWLDSKIENRSIAEITQQKAIRHNR